MVGVGIGNALACGERGTQRVSQLAVRVWFAGLDRGKRYRTFQVG